ncbi:MAG TPA: argininosuccinate synthase domain-containing protein, partial [Candidatus Kapabacteria bacterium]|nr:argininosuccinate synthase domain-containing protein [Candidatus Kapabacteria bacterium]
MKIVLAYSGGLDTSVLLSWIKEKYNAEMIAFCANIGQEEELKGLDKKAQKTGASKIYIDDLQEEFARDFIFPMI